MPILLEKKSQFVWGWVIVHEINRLQLFKFNLIIYIFFTLAQSFAHEIYPPFIVFVYAISRANCLSKKIFSTSLNYPNAVVW